MIARPSYRLALVGSAVSLAVLSGGAHAQFRDSEARQRADEMRAQIETLSRSIDTRFANVSEQLQDKRAIVELANQIEGLRAEVARMRGQMEVMQNSIEQGDRRARDLYNDLDGRFRRFEQQRADERKAAEEESQRRRVEEQKTQETAQSENRVYESALNQFKLGNYQLAITQFQTFMTQFPNSKFLPSAQYWIGNSHYALRDYRSAITAQTRVVQTWPEDSKAPDSLLNIATSQAEMGDVPASRATLQQLVTRYPQSPAADQAKQRLARRN